MYAAGSLAAAAAGVTTPLMFVLFGTFIRPFVSRLGILLTHVQVTSSVISAALSMEMFKISAISRMISIGFGMLLALFTPSERSTYK